MPPFDWPRPTTLSRRIRLLCLVWLAMVGLDFLLNGAVFVRMYSQGGGFVLEPAEAFRRIPLGYLALLVLAVGIVEAASRLPRIPIRDGLVLGTVAGVVFGATWALGLYSIATLKASTALTLGVTWVALVAIGWSVAFLGLAQKSLRRLAVMVGGADVSIAIIVIALQSSGLVPTTSA